MLQTDRSEPIEFREDHDAVTATTTVAAHPAAPAGGGELLFQRCLWCGTPDYRRSFCRACGATAFQRERSAGAGVLVRRSGQAPHSTWLVAMDEGFTVVCQVAETAPVVFAVGARVRVVRAVAPFEQGLPVVELTYRATSFERW
ncbi:zinc ribbon domain-containing protein [Streptomyces phyllanthi]|uniref:ChsH2 rubredoxin-like zinc ribbon domain-containing protein n=1 Tax=Streptomyces phyllanthi TaxID=1803180 RepID=A0A5N8W9J9_9ACTN|nr:zinc ribbon domain-containing protein [Streptomyces phyllanthi]MPY43108.1 hypothetical protein [Streptomyces phyllanthi]